MFPALFPNRKLSVSVGTAKLYQVDYDLEQRIKGSEIRVKKTATVTVLTPHDAQDACLIVKADLYSKLEPVYEIVSLSIVNVILMGEGPMP